MADAGGDAAKVLHQIVDVDALLAIRDGEQVPIGGKLYVSHVLGPLRVFDDAARDLRRCWSIPNGEFPAAMPHSIQPVVGGYGYCCRPQADTHRLLQLEIDHAPPANGAILRSRHEVWLPCGAYGARVDCRCVHQHQRRHGRFLR